MPRGPTNPVTPSDYPIFAERVSYWQALLNLNDWRIVISPKAAHGVMALVEKIDLEQRLAVLRLGSDFKSERVDRDTLDALARHEVLHIWLHEFKVVCQNPHSSQDDVLSAEHRLINTLDKVQLSSGKG